MTYLAFHFWFILPPIVLLLLLLTKPVAGIGTPAWRSLGLILLAAFLYTTPWDNYLVARGVWTYGVERVLGTIGYVPFEEYAFFLLQPVLTGLWVFYLYPRLGTENTGMSESSKQYKTVLIALGVFLFIVGLLLSVWGGSFLYFGLILAWLGPAFASLNWLGFRAVWPRRRLFAPAILVPTAYLCVADAIAIRNGIWHIVPEYSTEVFLFNLPVEEAFFFLATNWMVVMGLLMLLSNYDSESRHTNR